jgi:hypothetical protein
MSLESKNACAILNCPCCNKIFDDPRILECGNSISYKCASKAVNASKETINCPLCKQKHILTKSGLIPNIELDKLVKNESKRILCVLVDELKLKLDNIQTQKKSFSNDLKMGEFEIKDFCNIIREDIMSVSEIFFKRVQEQRAYLIRQVNEYESECVKQLGKIKNENKIHFERVIEEANKLSNEWTKYIELKSLNQEKIITGCKKADECIEKLKAETFDLQKSTFNGKVLKFEKKISQTDNLIGSIYFEDITRVNEEYESLDCTNSETCARNGGTNTPQYSPKKVRNNSYSNGKISNRFIILNSRKLTCDEDEDDDDDL